MRDEGKVRTAGEVPACNFAAGRLSAVDERSRARHDDRVQGAVVGGTGLRAALFLGVARNCVCVFDEQGIFQAGGEATASLFAAGVRIDCLIANGAGVHVCGDQDVVRWAIEKGTGLKAAGAGV